MKNLSLRCGSFHFACIAQLVIAACGLGQRTASAEPEPPFVFVASPSFTPSSPAIIPQPVEVQLRKGRFALTSRTRLIASAEARNEAEYLVASLERVLGARLPLAAASSTRDDAISLLLDEGRLAQFGQEGYELQITERRVTLSAATPAGLFYAEQSLLQILPAGRPLLPGSSVTVEHAEYSVACLRILDHPRFAWRGLLIDPARHFIPLADVKRFLDTMAQYKFNRLQIHLTDNEGWRVEIKRYPKLTEWGSSHDRSGGSGGYYRQEEIRDLVRYAKNRHITIVPEIEMPYHAGAAIVAYPQLGVNTKSLSELPVGQRWGRTKGLLGPTPYTVTFMQQVLSELMQLFPGQYIHIGGDEANVQLWADDPEIRAVMAAQHCADAHALHSWFVRQMDSYLSTHGRRMIGWDEILQGGLAPGATVMSWRGEGGGISAAKADHDVVMAPTSHTYFDYYQGPRAKEPKAIGGLIPLEKVYQYEPVPAALNEAQAKHVLGAQAQLWGEFISNARHLEYMAWPRACALAEIVWSPRTERNESEFLDRLRQNLRRLDAQRVNYRPLVRE